MLINKETDNKYENNTTIVFRGLVFAVEKQRLLDLLVLPYQEND